MKKFDCIRREKQAYIRVVMNTLHCKKRCVVSSGQWFGAVKSKFKLIGIGLILAILGIQPAFHLSCDKSSTSDPDQERAKDNFISTSSNREPLFSDKYPAFRVLILPFDRKRDCSAKQTDVAVSLYRELKRISEREDLGLEVQYLADKTCPATFSEGRGIGAAVNADLVIWGDQWVVCNNDTTWVCVAYALVDMPGVWHGEAQDESSVLALSSLSEIREGRLTKDIEYIIHWTLGLWAVEQRDYSTALNRFLDIEPERRLQDAEVVFRIGVCYDILDEIDSAFVFYNHTLNINPNNARAYTNLALLMTDHYQSHDSARMLYRKAIDINPYYAKTYYNLANLMKNHYQSYDSARALYRKAIIISPDYASAYINLANLMERYYQSYDSARKLYHKAIDIDPDNADAYINLANILQIHFESYDSARTLYHKAINNEPDKAAAYSNLAALLQTHFESYDSARTLYYKAIDIDPDDGQVYFNLAVLLRQQFREYDSARIYYETACRLNPTHKSPKSDDHFHQP